MSRTWSLLVFSRGRDITTINVSHPSVHGQIVKLFRLEYRIDYKNSL